MVLTFWWAKQRQTLKQCEEDKQLGNGKVHSCNFLSASLCIFYVISSSLPAERFIKPRPTRLFTSALATHLVEIQFVYCRRAGSTVLVLLGLHRPEDAVCFAITDEFRIIRNY